MCLYPNRCKNNCIDSLIDLFFYFRQKFQDIEAEAEKSGEFLKGGASVFKEKLQDVIEEAGKSEIGRKAGLFLKRGSNTKALFGVKIVQKGIEGSFILY